MFLLINKPAGPTSHDVISRLRKITGQKTIGHAGTLDPFAQGLLIVAVGRPATRQLSQLLKLDKIYSATLQLGAITDSYDSSGKITALPHCPKIKSPEKITAILTSLTGEQLQTPPSYSAKKINGHKAYELARQGKTPRLAPHKINIYQLKLNKLDTDKQQISLTITCSSGTYIRSLGHDIGQRLGSGAYLIQLKRLAIGPFKLKSAVALKKITPHNWQQLSLPALPALPAKKRVIIFGTFDLLHAGHLNFIRQAKQLGDELYIVVARDKNVLKLKGKLPQQNELQRLRQLRQLNLAQQVLLGSLNWTHRFRILNKIQPQIIALGYDQKINLTELKNKLHKYQLTAQIKRLKAYRPRQYKSSLLKKQLKK